MPDPPLTRSAIVEPCLACTRPPRRAADADAAIDAESVRVEREKTSWRDDRDVLERVEDQQVFIPGHETVGR